MADEQIVFDANTEAVKRAYASVLEADKALLAQVQRTIAASQAGSKQWLEAKTKETQILRTIAKDQDSLTKKAGEFNTETQRTEGIGRKAFGAMQVAIGALGLKALLDQMTEYRRELGRAELAHAKLFKPLEVAAAGRSPALRKAVSQAAITAGVTVEEAAGTAALLMREGVDRKEASGATLVEALKAEQTFGKGVSQDIVGLLDAQGIAITPGNIRSVAASMSGLIGAGAELGTEGLGAARESGRVLQGAGLDLREQFAGIAALQDAGRKGSELEGIVQAIISMEASEKEGRELALKAIGLKPEDVDLAGEDLFEALRRVDEGITKHHPDIREPLLKNILGKQGISAGGTILLDAIRSGKVSELVAAQQGDAGLGAREAAALGSEQATENRLKVQADLAKAGKGGDSALVRQSLETYLLQKGMSGPEITAALKAFDVGVIGAGPDKALSSAFLATPGLQRKGLIGMGAFRGAVLGQLRSARESPVSGVELGDLAVPAGPAPSLGEGPSYSELVKSEKAELVKSEKAGSAEKGRLDQIRSALSFVRSSKAAALASGGERSEREINAEFDPAIKELQEQEKAAAHKAREAKGGGGDVEMKDLLRSLLKVNEQQLERMTEQNDHNLVRNATSL